MTDTAITARCWEDLVELADKHSPDTAIHVLKVFEERRAVNPESGETMSGVGGPLRKLHADLSGGRSLRAVTWYDRGHDVCWLIAAGEHDVYDRVEQLAKTNGLLPTATDIANFEADTPIRLMSRVVRAARPAMEQAISQPGTDVPLTESPPPKVYLRVVDDRLWVRVVMYDADHFELTQKQLAALEAAIFGDTRATPGWPPDGGSWDSVYLEGPVPSLDNWPPPAQPSFP